MPARDADPANELGAGRISPAVEAWLLSRGAVFARIAPSGVVEFSARPIRDALADAARSLIAASAPLDSRPEIAVAE